MKYTELPKAEQPRHRINELGAGALTTAELLATALWISETDPADQLAALYREYGSLAAIPAHKISEIKGLGQRYADAVKAVAEIARREITGFFNTDRPRIHGPQDAANLVQYDMRCLGHEEMWVLLLDTRNNVIRIEKLYKQTLNSANVRIGEIFKAAISENAAAIILVHNHPSGDPSPSPEDVAVTRAIVDAGKLMDVDVLDHLVIGSTQFVSLKERGLGFS